MPCSSWRMLEVCFPMSFFFSSIVLLPMASWTISQVFPLHSQVRTQWRLLAKALMTPRSKSMNPIQKSPKSQSEIFGSWGSSYQYQYIYIYTLPLRHRLSPEIRRPAFHGRCLLLLPGLPPTGAQPSSSQVAPGKPWAARNVIFNHQSLGIQTWI